MEQTPTLKLYEKVIFFFPFQLIWVQLKSNTFLLLFWVVLSLIVSGHVGANFGLINLFLYPEYLGNVDWISHAILGFAIGGFILAFQLASYILNGAKFPFLVTLKSPFTKYSINNFIFPLGFLILICYQMYHFQVDEELLTPGRVLLHLLAFLLGVTLNVILGFGYFFSTNKNIHRLFEDVMPGHHDEAVRPVQSFLSRRERWYSFLHRQSNWRVTTFLNGPFEIGVARDTSHYSESMLRTVFAQNHLNGSLFELVIVISVIFFSRFSDTPTLILPAAAGLMLIFTLIIMFTSAIYSWFKGWAAFVLILCILGYDIIVQKSQDAFNSFAYGINYEPDPSEYNTASLNAWANNQEAHQLDIERQIRILEQWKQQTGEEKPKLVVVNCSGGGLRAALWSFVALQYGNNKTGGDLYKHTALMTGSSGGMIGAAYYRSTQYEEGIDPSDPFHMQAVSSDLLNAVSTDIALHDWFVRFREVEHSGRLYKVDRGYSWDLQLNKNTGGLLDHPLSYFSEPEQQASMPQLVLTPYIVNDGRRLIIGSNPMSFLSGRDEIDKNGRKSIVESVDIHQLLANHNPDSLSFLTALRMSASYFYILPSVDLPTNPKIQVMDAGLRDNIGLITTMRYIHFLEDWIVENTSGVVILQVRDKEKRVDIRNNTTRSFLLQSLEPLASLYDNFLNIQTYNQDELLLHLNPGTRNMVELIEFDLERTIDDNISLSWHLTNREKRKVIQSIRSENNARAIERLSKALNE